MSKKRKNKRKISRISISIISFVWILVFVLAFNLLISSIKNKNKLKSIISKVKIPEGFYYVGGDIDTGVVISDNKNDEFKGTEYEKVNKLKGNQFVWVPVEKAVAENYTEAEELVKKEIFPIAIKDNEKYKALVYIFDTYLNKYLVVSQDNYNKEPYVIIGEEQGDNEKYIEGSTKELYQDSFNKMVESVEKNKGFYISRYEIGNLANAINQNGKVVSKSNESDISNQTWVDMYKVSKEMYEREDLSTEMIWGCQWDATIAWILNTSNKIIKVEDVKENGNYNFKLKSTGSNDMYSFNNIYDLCGNVSEFSQRSSQGSSRIAYGESFSNSKEYSLNARFGYGNTYKSSDIGLRLTMYLN